MSEIKDGDKICGVKAVSVKNGQKKADAGEKANEEAKAKDKTEPAKATLSLKRPRDDTTEETKEEVEEKEASPRIVVKKVVKKIRKDQKAKYSTCKLC